MRPDLRLLLRRSTALMPFIACLHAFYGASMLWSPLWCNICCLRRCLGIQQQLPTMAAPPWRPNCCWTTAAIATASLPQRSVGRCVPCSMVMNETPCDNCEILSNHNHNITYQLLSCLRAAVLFRGSSIMFVPCFVCACVCVSDHSVLVSHCAGCVNIWPEARGPHARGLAAAYLCCAADAPAALHLQASGLPDDAI